MLQTLLMMIVFAANLVQAAWSDYEETRDLSLDADGVKTLRIEAGAGSLDVTGVEGSVTIDDGSGSIDVSDGAGDLLIPDDGSGSVDFSGIAGRVEQAD